MNGAPTNSSIRQWFSKPSVIIPLTCVATFIYFVAWMQIREYFGWRLGPVLGVPLVLSFFVIPGFVTYRYTQNKADRWLYVFLTVIVMFFTTMFYVAWSILRNW